METMIDALQDVVLTEPEVEVQPDPAQPDDAAVETELTQEISTLWSDHVRLSANHKTTAKELRQIRARLAERLHAMKSFLCRPDRGRASQWRSWLRHQGIPRSTADRLVTRHGETFGGHEERLLSGAPSEQAETAAEKLAKSVWHRFGKLLSTDESVIQFIGQIAELAGVGHEQRAEGLVIFVPAAKAAEELHGSASASGPLPQPSDEACAVTEEPKNETAVTPTEIGLAVAAAETGNGVAA
jgi:hypothetical protein